MTSSANKKDRTVFVDPRFALEWRDIDDFLNEFGPYNGRYIPGLPKNWVELFKSHLDDLGLQPVKKQEYLTKAWQKARLCIDPKNWEWNDSKGWNQNVQHHIPKERNPIVIGNALDPLPFLSWADGISEIRESGSTSWTFIGSVNSYYEICRPLLVMSPSAYLIDPYLDPFDSEVKKLIKYFLYLMSGSKCYSIEIVRSFDEKNKRFSRNSFDYESIRDELENQYGSFVPKKCSLKIHILKDKRGNEISLHDRFFLTKVGAISFGHGFNLSAGGSYQNAHVIDERHHEFLRNAYINSMGSISDASSKKGPIIGSKNIETVSISR